MSQAIELFLQPAVEALQDLLPELTFTGGAVVGLLITDPAAPPVRPTVDVDVIAAVSSLAQYAAKEQWLFKSGFHPDQDMRGRYWRGRLCLDMMASSQAAGTAWNRWLPEAVRSARVRKLLHLPGQPAIQLVDAAVFVALKLEAFLDRGNDDLILSHDMEDIISLVDGRPTLPAEIAAAPTELAKEPLNNPSNLA